MTMLPEEALAMLGTEFIYEYENGDTIPAYVKKIDLETGKMSCFSLADRTTRDGWMSRVPEAEKVDGAWCVIATRSLPGLFSHLEIIRDTGRYRVKQSPTASGGAGISCAFG